MAIPAGTKAGVWAFIFIFWAVGTIWLFYGPSANSFPRRFDLDPPGIGKLHTLRWSFDFWVSAMYILMWTVPITLAFAMDSPTSKWRLTIHNVFVVLYALWILATFIHGCVFWGNANSTSPEYYNNPAHDDRWCCVNYNLPGAPCTQTSACNPGVGASDLTTNGVFLWNLWWSFVGFILLVVDFILSMAVIRPAFEKEILRDQAKRARRDEKLLPDQDDDEEEVSDYESSERQIRSKIGAPRGRKVNYKARGK